MRLFKDRFYLGISLFSFFIPFIIYFITKAPTVSFWDCGEFIAASYILGVPHPPGYPMFIILGRLFTMLPIAGEIAVRVNLLSVLGGAATAFMAYWLILRLVLGRGYKPGWLAKTGIALGALAGSLIMAFAQTVWANAIEAEVYTLAMFLMLLINYLALIWGQAESGRRNDNLLIMISYLAWLSLGIHMTAFVIVLPATIYMAYIDYKYDGLARWPVWALLAFFLLYAVPAHIEILYAIGLDISAYELETFIIMFCVIFFCIGATAVIARIRKSGNLKTWTLALAVMISAVAGYSSQVYIPIRAAQRPAINENDPQSWSRFKDFMERKQYGQESMIRRMMKRRGSWFSQFVTHPRFGFLGIFNSQYADPETKVTLFKPGGEENGGPAGFSVSLAMIYILIIGLYGIYGLVRRAPPEGTFIVFATLLCTAGLVLYMNFSDGSFNPDLAPVAEVRDRDYFYTPGFIYYAVIIGAGLAFFLGYLGRLADSFVKKNKLIFIPFALSLLLTAGLVLNTAAANLKHNDRRGNYLPYDYARNILGSCARDAIIFTNGDNDTFPLWFMQEVEQYRTDVRIVNLSLLNTTWYIRQIRDLMKVPIDLSDEEIDDLRPFRLSYGDTIYRIQDQMIERIFAGVQSEGWKIPLYFAITVPSSNRRGLDDYLVMEGLAYRVVSDPGGRKVNPEIGLRIFGDRANFRGISDPAVNKDDNDRRLINNYIVSIFQMADYYYQQGQSDSALIVARLAVPLESGDWPWQLDAFMAKLYAAAGDYDGVDSLAAKSAEGENIYLAASQEFLREGDLDKAEEVLKLTLKRFPSSAAALNNLAALYHQRGDSASFDSLMADFRRRNIDDPYIAEMVDQLVEKFRKLPTYPSGE